MVLCLGAVGAVDVDGVDEEDAVVEAAESAPVLKSEKIKNTEVNDANGNDFSEDNDVG